MVCTGRFKNCSELEVDHVMAQRDEKTKPGDSLVSDDNRKLSKWQPGDLEKRDVKMAPVLSSVSSPPDFSESLDDIVDCRWWDPQSLCNETFFFSFLYPVGEHLSIFTSFYTQS